MYKVIHNRQPTEEYKGLKIPIISNEYSRKYDIAHKLGDVPGYQLTRGGAWRYIVDIDEGTRVFLPGRNGQISRDMRLQPKILYHRCVDIDRLLWKFYVELQRLRP